MNDIERLTKNIEKIDKWLLDQKISESRYKSLLNCRSDQERCIILINNQRAKSLK